MAIFNSANILFTTSLANLTTAYLLLTSPLAVLNSSFVAILGPSMRIPPPKFTSSASPVAHIHPASSPFAAPSASLALAALFLGFIALNDLGATALLPEEAYFVFWTTQLPLRLVVLLGLVGWIYVTKPGVALDGYAVPTGVGAELKNSVVFTWAFVMMMLSFWMYNLVREERTAALKKQQEKQARLAEML